MVLRSRASGGSPTFAFTLTSEVRSSLFEPRSPTRGHVVGDRGGIPSLGRGLADLRFGCCRNLGVPSGQSDAWLRRLAADRRIAGFATVVFWAGSRPIKEAHGYRRAIRKLGDDSDLATQSIDYLLQCADAHVATAFTPRDRRLLDAHFFAQFGLSPQNCLSEFNQRHFLGDQFVARSRIAFRLALGNSANNSFALRAMAR